MNKIAVMLYSTDSVEKALWLTELHSTTLHYLAVQQAHTQTGTFENHANLLASRSYLGKQTALHLEKGFQNVIDCQGSPFFAQVFSVLI